MALNLPPSDENPAIEPGIEAADPAARTSEPESPEVFMKGERHYVTLPLEMYQALESRVEELEQAIDNRKTEDSISWFAAQGHTPGKFLSPPEEEFVAAEQLARSWIMALPTRVVANLDVEHRLPKTPQQGLDVPVFVRSSASGPYSGVRSALPPAHTSQPGALRHKRKTTQGT
jgi:hypothetical protein